MPRFIALLLAEGHAVSALVHAGVGFVGAYQNALQRAEVGLIAMMGALLYGAFDALICVTVHRSSSFFGDVLIMTNNYRNIRPFLSCNN